MRNPQTFYKQSIKVHENRPKIILYQKELFGWPKMTFLRIKLGPLGSPVTQFKYHTVSWVNMLICWLTGASVPPMTLLSFRGCSRSYTRSERAQYTWEVDLDQVVFAYTSWHLFEPAWNTRSVYHIRIAQLLSAKLSITESIQNLLWNSLNVLAFIELFCILLCCVTPTHLVLQEGENKW